MFEMLDILEKFFQIFHQFVGNMTKNLQFWSCDLKVAKKFGIILLT